MRKSFILLLSFLILTPCLAQQETITITTYYPAPYGVYRTLRLYPIPENPANPAPGDTVPACTANDEGSMYYDNNNNQVMMCSHDADGNPVWQGVGLWTRQGNDVFLPDTNWNVGIGTTTPQAKLDIDGGVKIGGVDGSACGAAIPGSAGIMRYNSTNNQAEYCNGTVWVSMGPSEISNIIASAPKTATVTANCPVGQEIIYAAGFVNDYNTPCNTTPINWCRHCNPITWLDCIGETTCTYTGITTSGGCGKPGYTCLQILCQ